MDQRRERQRRKEKKRYSMARLSDIKKVNQGYLVE